VFDNTRYTVHEVQYVKGDFGSWRLYLHNWQTGTAANLPVSTHGGSTAFAPCGCERIVQDLHATDLLAAKAPDPLE